MKKSLIYFIYFLLIQSCQFMSNENEANIIAKQLPKIESLLEAKKINPLDFELLLLALKKERILKCYARNKGKSNWDEIVKYDFCTFSGTLGPKRKEGDKQIPEGFYKIDRFNSKSRFHLSLGLDYPNQRDLKYTDQDKPGSDIFIHGGCRSVGCIAITDEKIEELYTLAKLTDQVVEVIILPFDANENTLNQNIRLYPTIGAFWKQLFAELKTKELKLSN